MGCNKITNLCGNIRPLQVAKSYKALYNLRLHVELVVLARKITHITTLKS